MTFFRSTVFKWSVTVLAVFVVGVLAYSIYHSYKPSDPVTHLSVPSQTQIKAGGEFSFTASPAKEAKTWVADVVKDEQGNLVPTKEGEGRNRSNWFTSVPSGDSLVYKANIPKETPSGKYTVALVTEKENKQTVELVAFEVDNPKVPAVHDVYLNGTTQEGQDVVFHFWNSGTVTETVEASFRISSFEGQELSSGNIEVGEVFEHSGVDKVVKDFKELGPGNYIVNLKISYGEESRDIDFVQTIK